MTLATVPNGRTTEERELTEQLRNLQANRSAYPDGLSGTGLCHCPAYEGHEGRCLGSYCYCH